MIRVLVVASSPVVRAGLESMLRDDSRLTVLTTPGANSTPNADVLVVETAATDRFATIPARIRVDGPPVVLLADHLGRAELRRVLHWGVRAVLPRDAPVSEIAAAIEGAAAGLTVLSTEDVEALLPVATDAVQTESVPGEALTSRELEVLSMLAEGLGNKDIAARLKISEHTVKFHVSSILGKLGASTRGEAVARGVREGLVVL
jgi:DNA-binding NarL/FixJ family response regulator